MQEKLGSCLGIAHLVKKLHRAPILAFIQVGETTRNCGISPGNPSDGLWLPDGIRRIHLEYGLANSRTSLEVKRQHAEPRLAKIKKPGIVAVFLRHLSAFADNLEHVAELPHAEQRDSFSAHGKKMLHEGGGLVEFRDAFFENLKGFKVISLQCLDVRINHLVKWWSIPVTKFL